MDTLPSPASNSKTTFIYGLKDPRTLVIRYVGKSNNPKERLQSHIGDCEVFNYPIYIWMRKLKYLGLSPILVILEEVSRDVWIEAESRWIQYYRQMHPRLILNVCHGGEGGLDVRNARRGVQHGSSKYNDALIIEVRQLRYDGASLADLSEKFSIPIGTIASICVGNSWKHVGGPVTKGKRGGNYGKQDYRRPWKLTKHDEAEIRWMTADGYTLKQIARKLHVSKSTIVRFNRYDKSLTKDGDAHG